MIVQLAHILFCSASWHQWFAVKCWVEMARLCKTLLFLLCSLSEPFTRADTAETEWDTLLFVQSWLPTTCGRERDKFPGLECAMPAPAERWAVHGLWPSGARAPAHCGAFAGALTQRNLTGIQRYLAGIQRDLDRAWFDIKQGPVSIWEHEWYKHGSCLTEHPALDSHIKYFQHCLLLHKIYDIYAALDKVGILPSMENSSKMADFVDAIRDSFGHTPWIMCSTVDNQQIISEVRFCFNKTLEAMDCNTSHLSQLGNERIYNISNHHDCDPARDVYYPIYDHGGN